jgi:hypothetical protein
VLDPPALVGELDLVDALGKTVHEGQGHPRQPVGRRDARAVLQARAIELHVVEEHQHVGAPRLVEEAGPGEIFRLVDGDRRHFT